MGHEFAGDLPRPATTGAYAPRMRTDAGVPDRTVQRLMSVLDAFTSKDTRLSGAELARRTGLPRSTAHRLATEMTGAGLLEQEPNGGFRLSMRLFELGHLAILSRGLRESAAGFLADLSNATHETVHLAVLDGLDVVYLDIIRTSASPKLNSRPGGRMPPSCTGVGKAILAHSSPQLVEEFIARGLPQLTRNSITDGTRFRAHLAHVRRTGLAYDREENAIGTVCCAAPILGSEGKAIGAISVTGRAGILRLDRVGMAVRSAAAGISRTQGWGRVMTCEA